MVILSSPYPERNQNNGTKRDSLMSQKRKLMKLNSHHYRVSCSAELRVTIHVPRFTRTRDSYCHTENRYYST